MAPSIREIGEPEIAFGRKVGIVYFHCFAAYLRRKNNKLGNTPNGTFQYKLQYVLFAKSEDQRHNQAKDGNYTKHDGCNSEASRAVTIAATNTIKFSCS